MASTVDCGDKTCNMDYQFSQTCILYVDLNEEQVCQYPCSFVNCKSEIHHLVLCPIWSCDSKTTPTPDISTLSPLPPLPTASYCSPTCVTSLIFNGIFGLIFLALGMLIFFRYRRSRALSNFYSQVNPLFVESQGPIIRNAERIPLLSRESSNSGPALNQSNDLPLNPNLNQPSSEASLPNFYDQIHAAVLPTVQETAF